MSRCHCRHACAHHRRRDGYLALLLGLMLLLGTVLELWHAVFG